MPSLHPYFCMRCVKQEMLCSLACSSCAMVIGNLLVHLIERAVRSSVPMEFALTVMNPCPPSSSGRRWWGCPGALADAGR
eukprot:6487067-Pyramimonas_sp.AAC.1